MVEISNYPKLSIKLTGLKKNHPKIEKITYGKYCVIIYSTDYKSMRIKIWHDGDEYQLSCLNISEHFQTQKELVEFLNSWK